MTRRAPYEHAPAASDTPQYWRSLEERSRLGDSDFLATRAAEFPMGVGEPASTGSVGRRGFMGWLGAAFALAGAEAGDVEPARRGPREFVADRLQHEPRVADDADFRRTPVPDHQRVDVDGSRQRAPGLLRSEGFVVLGPTAGRHRRQSHRQHDDSDGLQQHQLAQGRGPVQARGGGPAWTSARSHKEHALNCQPPAPPPNMKTLPATKQCRI